MYKRQAYYGVQTQRAINNYKISNSKMCDYPEFVISIAYVKKAAAAANAELGALDKNIAEGICKAADEVIGGKLWENFPVDMMQGGAGTSVNMNANEVIANRALELMGYEKGDYPHCYPNDHVNCGQSTNDAYPTACLLYTSLQVHARAVHPRPEDRPSRSPTIGVRRAGRDREEAPRIPHRAPRLIFRTTRVC